MRAVDTGNYPRAISFQRKSVQMRDAIKQQPQSDIFDHTYYASSRGKLANLLADNGQYEEALEVIAANLFQQENPWPIIVIKL